MPAENNAKARIQWTLTAWAWTATVKSWWNLFGTTYPYKAKIEQVSWTWVVEFREIVTVTNRVSNNFTFSRATEKCPANDSATSQTQTAFEFTDDSIITFVKTAQDFEDIDDELNINIPADLALKLDKTTYDLEKNVFWASTQWDDDYQITDSSITAYQDWQPIRIRCDVANTWASTIEINALWAKALKKQQWTIDLETWDILTNWIITVIYNSVLDVFQYVWQLGTIVATSVGKTQTIFTAWEDLIAWEPVFVNWAWLLSSSTITQTSFNTTEYAALNWDWNFGTTFIPEWNTWSSSEIISVMTYRWASSHNDAGATLSATIYDNPSKTTNLWSKTINNLPVDSEITITFDTPIDLTAWTEYYIEWVFNETFNLLDFQIRKDTTNPYADWVLYVNWTIKTGEDLYFNVVQIVDLSTIDAIYKTDASDSQRLNFIWFADTTVSATDSVQINSGWIDDNQSWLTTESDYYLSDTPWGISTTPWTNPVKIWKAVSATEIEIQTNNDWHLTWITSSSVTAWGLTPPNITEYITIKVNWVDRKIAVYAT